MPKTKEIPKTRCCYSCARTKNDVKLRLCQDCHKEYCEMNVILWNVSGDDRWACGWCANCPELQELCVRVAAM